MAPAPPVKGTGIDMQRAAVMDGIDEKGDAKIQVFLKSGPSTRAPAFVARNISINDPATSPQPASPLPNLSRL